MLFLVFASKLHPQSPSETLLCICGLCLPNVCAVCVTILTVLAVNSRLVSNSMELHTLTPVAHSYVLLLLPIMHQRISAPSFHVWVQCVSNCFTNKLQLMLFACSFCYGSSKQHNNGYMTLCPDLALQPNTFPGST